MKTFTGCGARPHRYAYTHFHTPGKEIFIGCGARPHRLCLSLFSHLLTDWIRHLCSRMPARTQISSCW
ncbi:hypothetical protein HanRHA438_Chr12g0571681 [Helianthus annuus]|nr:hypothetical protein HanRHA438_Chr12g0571681 [Helianthus annuus]